MIYEYYFYILNILKHMKVNGKECPIYYESHMNSNGK